MKSAISILILSVLLTPLANGKNKSNLRIKQAIQKNAADIAENTDSIDANTQAIADIQVQAGKRQLYVHIEGHGNIGELIFGDFNHSGIQNEEYTFLGDEGYFDVGTVKYLDAICTQPIIAKQRAVYRFLGKPVITGLEPYTGQLYTASADSQQHQVNEYYNLTTFNNETGESFDSPQCIKAPPPFEGENIFYSVSPIETPTFLAPRVNEQNGVTTTDYLFDGETTIRFE